MENTWYFGIAFYNIGKKINYQQTAQSINSSDNSCAYNLKLKSFELPRQTHIIVNYNHELSHEHAVMFTLNHRIYSNGMDRTAFGVECSYQRLFYVRASYQNLEEANRSLNSNLAFGFALKIQVCEASKIELDYAYRNVEFSEFGASSSFGLSFIF